MTTVKLAEEFFIRANAVRCLPTNDGPAVHRFCPSSGVGIIFMFALFLRSSVATYYLEGMSRTETVICLMCHRSMFVLFDDGAYRKNRAQRKRNFQLVPGASCSLGPLAQSLFLLARISFFCLGLNLTCLAGNVARETCLPRTRTHLPRASGQGFCRALKSALAWSYFS